MDNQTLKNYLLERFPSAAELQSYLTLDIWPAYKQAAKQNRQIAEAERIAKLVAGARERRENDESEKYSRQGYVKLPDGKWQKPRQGQSAEELVQEWHDRKAGKPVLMPPAMAAAWDEFMKNKNRP